LDWSAFGLSLKLAGWTCAILIPTALVIGRLLAGWKGPLKGVAEAAITLPLVLPPTVLGYYLLVGMGAMSPLGRVWESVFGQGLVFHFSGLLAASVLVNIPFAIQPVQRAMEAVPAEVREAAYVSGLSRWQTFRRIDLPLAWPGVFSALALTFAHTLGEFGVVLMVGGNIEGQTRTAAIAIYDRAQAFDTQAASAMAAALLAFSIAAIGVSYALTGGRRRG
jgi:molybdate transport system permease protein